ncbi:hypothetical protein RFF05_08355 [Bengtsoniella intestinalis]|uniref:hypothetical protein n=1 Tax=Bengtsoniella intestinalis TaxID=3073143 RepID=UPI00391F8D92
MKKKTMIATGVVASLLALSWSALAAQIQIAYNQIGVTVRGDEQISIGSTYTAPNGEEVPSSITYTDATGATTNYLSIRQISELLDAQIQWNSETQSVEIAPLGVNTDLLVTSGVTSGSTSSGAQPFPEYGLVIGAFEEIDPSTLDFSFDDIELPRMYMKDTQIRYEYCGFPEYALDVTPEVGSYIVFTVTNNGDKDATTTVARVPTISYGYRERFTSVTVSPGETLTRVFYVHDDANPFEYELRFGISGGGIVPGLYTDVTVSLQQYDV